MLFLKFCNPKQLENSFIRVHFNILCKVWLTFSGDDVLVSGRGHHDVHFAQDVLDSNDPVTVHASLNVQNYRCWLFAST